MAQRLLPRVLLLLAALFATLPARAFAQAGTSGLTGVVTDPSGTAMDRVHIVVLDPATGFSRETETNNTGNDQSENYWLLEAAGQDDTESGGLV